MPVKNRRKSKIGETLKSLRSEARISQDKLATMAELTTRYYQELEAGDRTPSMKTLFKLAHALQIHPAKLLDTEWEYFKENPENYAGEAE